MEQMNSLILYKDWLILTRGKIKPKVSDEVVIIKNNLPTIKIIETIQTPSDNTDFELINLTFAKTISDWEYLGNCYVEVTYPVIEWTDETINPDIIFGTVGIFNIIQIHKTKLNGYENVWSFQQPDNGNVFEGTIEECKNFANKLLYET